MENLKEFTKKSDMRNLCRYYVATEEGAVVSWFPFISGEAELKCTSTGDAELLLKICHMFGICEYVEAPDIYMQEPFWYVKEQELHTTLFTLESDNVSMAWKVEEYIAEHTVGKLITVSQDKWDSICSDYKGIWQDYYDECPEWKGRRVVMSGCITEDPVELGKLLVEGVHFEISGRSDV